MLCFCYQDIVSLNHNGSNIIATEMEALYPQETRDLEIIDVCAGTGLVAEKVENPEIKLFNQC